MGILGEKSAWRWGERCRNTAWQHGGKEARKLRFDQLLSASCDHESVQKMKGFCQHGTVSTYQHCVSVAWLSFSINDALHMGSDEKSLVRAAFLHDYYGYDWHETANKTHAVNHPVIAEQRAARDFPLTDKERNIIRSHMWPLPPTRVPACREAWLVCVSDKVCALYETLFCRGSFLRQR